MSRYIWYKLTRTCAVGFGITLAAIGWTRAVRMQARTGKKTILGRILHPVRDRAFARMPFRFDQQKAIQAMAFLLKQSDNRRGNYMRLIKLLYVADRESLKETGRPITGDKFVAMERGPVLSHILDLIKDRSRETAEWKKFIQRRRYHIELVADPGDGELSQYDKEKLMEIWTRYQDFDEWAMVRETHKLREWKKNDPGKSSKPISLSDVLTAVGLSAERQNEILADARELRELDHFFGTP